MIGAGPVGTSPAPTEFAAPWGARGYVTQLDGPVHWIEFGQDGPGTPGKDQPGKNSKARRSSSCTAWAART